MFDLIKQCYDTGYYTKDNLDLFVNVGWITKDQEAEILGQTATVSTDTNETK